ncbi:P-loop NTPase fold protein [Aliarcobacter butzleri]|uniref:P-loop NTPase fold protein n=1 Tax=Aliarcobacter butzleri TaxID=28197 RepID=UPI0021B2D9E8|nr:P-loop NTPase fold protein [Aliarcobacter butzleri]MCT7537107.1 P-loop NTPase fold protein [Aliarcobacter butzleri]MCT7623587.1 P-loop NTPase fold protein [Aliarcobacter butzleri]
MPKIFEIESLLEENNNIKILLAGHMGSGKSTELHRLSYEIKKNYEVIKFSIQETNDPIGIQYEDLLVSSVDQVLNYLNTIGKLEEIDTSLIVRFKEWINNVEIIKEKTEKSEINANVEVSAKAEVGFILKFMAKLSSTLKLGSEEKIIYRVAIDKTVTQLLTLSKELFIVINKILEKELVLIIEDLDKIDTEKAKEIFIDKSSILINLPLKVIYTVPIFLLYKSEFSVLEGNTFSCITLPMIKTRTSNDIDDIYNEGIEKIKELVSKRMNLSLFEDTNTLDFLIKNTGGVLRDLFQVIVKSSKLALYQKKEVITKDIIEIYLKEKSDFYYRSLSGSCDRKINPSNLIDTLVNLYANNILKPKSVDENIIELLRAQVLIEYNGPDTWYGIHPLMISHIKKQI